MNTTAYLSIKEDHVIFSYLDRDIRFRCPKGLMRFENVVQWDKGYLVVNARYSHTEGIIEDYIDLIPLLHEMNVNAEEFLNPIERVELLDAGK